MAVLGAISTEIISERSTLEPDAPVIRWIFDLLLMPVLEACSNITMTGTCNSVVRNYCRWATFLIFDLLDRCLKRLLMICWFRLARWLRTTHEAFSRPRIFVKGLWWTFSGIEWQPCFQVDLKSIISLFGTHFGLISDSLLIIHYTSQLHPPAAHYSNHK